MKKISVILLALLLALFCAACGNDESPDKEKNETGKVTTTVTDSADPDIEGDADETENEEVICFDCDMVMSVEEWQDHLNASHGGSEWAECMFCHCEYSIKEEDHGECTEEGA